MTNKDSIRYRRYKTCGKPKKFSEDQIYEMIRLWKVEKKTAREIGIIFNITETAARNYLYKREDSDAELRAPHFDGWDFSGHNLNIRDGYGSRI